MSGLINNETSSTLVGTRCIYLPDHGSENPNNTNPLECSIHTLPKQLLREFRHVFSEECKQMPDSVGKDCKSDPTTPILLAIPTNQMAKHDLVAMGDHIEAEKDRLLNVFLKFARDLSQKIKSKGHWADYIDPCSGLPMLATHNHNKVYSEVDGMEVLLNFRSYNAGFCKILLHPKWGSAVYPATIFAYAPWGMVKELLDQYSTTSSA